MTKEEEPITNKDREQVGVNQRDSCFWFDWKALLASQAWSILVRT